jgi:hypothetical protein
MPLPPRRRSLALAVALAGSLPWQAVANDLTLKATHIPASACGFEAGGTYNADLNLGYGVVGVPGFRGSLDCALPIYGVDLGRKAKDGHDMTSFTVHYKDVDGSGTGAGVQVALVESKVVGGQQQTTRPVCTWDSNRVAATGPSADQPCALDLAATSFYTFVVSVYNDLDGDRLVIAAEFYGIRFP